MNDEIKEILISLVEYNESSRWGDEKLGKLASRAQKALWIGSGHNKKSSDVDPYSLEEYKHELDF